MDPAVSRPVGSVGRAMFREITYAPDAAAVAAILRAYLTGPTRDEAYLFLAAYLCRTAAGFIPDPDRLDP